MKDEVVHGNAVNHVKFVIFPSTYTGGPRNLHEYEQDATTCLRYGGKSSFFITYTFNSNCVEEMCKKTCARKSDPWSSKIEGHELVARIFPKKIIKFMYVLTKGQVFGKLN